MNTTLLLSLLLPACGLRDYIPQGPSLRERPLQRWLHGANDDPVGGDVAYQGAPRVEFPIIPLQLFALTYAEDIVLETDHPHWSMHEYARIQVDGRDIWIAKDSDNDGVQTVTADLQPIEEWLPEVPVPRRAGPVDVDDRSTPQRLDITLRYTNPLGEAVVVDFSAPRQAGLEKKRNGSTFNHSQQVVSVLLDIPHRRLSGTRARVTFDGTPARIRRVLGLVPVKALLEQTQAGFAAASMLLRALGPDTLSVTRPLPDTPWPTASQETWSIQHTTSHDCSLQHEGPVARQVYDLHDGELVSAGVVQPGATEPHVQLRLSQPLPDLSRPFTGPITRRFALMMSGSAHGHGELRVRWVADDEVLVEIRPLAPFWFAERPMDTRIHFLPDGAVELVSLRVE